MHTGRIGFGFIFKLPPRTSPLYTRSLIVIYKLHFKAYAVQIISYILLHTGLQFVLKISYLTLFAEATITLSARQGEQFLHYFAIKYRMANFGWTCRRGFSNFTDSYWSLHILVIVGYIRKMFKWFVHECVEFSDMIDFFFNLYFWWYRIFDGTPCIFLRL